MCKVEEIKNTAVKVNIDYNWRKIINITLLFGFITGMIYLIWNNPLKIYNLLVISASIVSLIGFGIALNTYKVRNYNYIIFLGIVYGFVGIFDLIYLLSSLNIIILINNTKNIPITVWVFGRYIQSISLLIATRLIYKSVNTRLTIFLYATLSILILLGIFCLNIFPDSYIEETGHTNFRLISEYTISIICLSILILIAKNYRYFQSNIYKLIFASTLALFLSQLLLVIFLDSSPVFNSLLYLLRFMSFYFIYKAVGVVSIKIPYKKGEDMNYELSKKNFQLEKMNKELKEENSIKELLNNKLQESEKILKAILNSTENGVLVVDNNNNIIHANNRFVEMFNVSNDLLEFRDNNRLISCISEQLKEPDKFVSRIQELKTRKKLVKDILYFKDGRIFRRVTCPLLLKEKSIGQVIVIQDITQQRKMEEKLIESERLYRTVVESSTDGLFIHDGEKLIFANKSGIELLGASSLEEIIGMNVMDFIHPDYYDLIKKRIYLIKNENKNQPLVEEKIVRLDGSIVEVEAATTPIYYNGKKVMLSTFRDISERKKAEILRKEVKIKEKLLEKEREYSELKNQFFSNISHELKTPLNVILGTLQVMALLQENKKSLPKLKKYISVLRQNSYRLIRLVNNIVDMNKISAGFYKLNLQNCNIVSVVEDICFSVIDYIKNRDIDLVFDTDVEEKITACDIDKIERILLNLLSNAVKFTDPGGSIAVTVEDKGDKVNISVKDTGVGIPEDKLEKIFDRFAQVESTIKRNKEGSGIGLSLVKSLVHMHDGNIFVKSQLGKGTEFIIQLPVKQLHDDESSIIDKDEFKQGQTEKIDIEFSDIYMRIDE